jgi:ABC-type nitrate/sulfonate/bicarbonate transport system permease component
MTMMAPEGSSGGRRRVYPPCIAGDRRHSGIGIDLDLADVAPIGEGRAGRRHHGVGAFSAVFPVIVASSAAAEGVERVMVWSALSLGAGRQLLREIALPAALPQIFTGLQVALPIALIVEIVSEMAMGGEGIITQMRFADSPGVFSGIVAIAIVGSVLVKAMELIRRRLLVWHPETTR